MYILLEPMPRKTTGTSKKFESLGAHRRNDTQHLGPAPALRIQDFIDNHRPVLVNVLLAREATTEG